MSIKLLAFVALGPVSGPIAAFALHSARRGQWWRVAASGAALIAFYTVAPALLAALLGYDAALLSR